MSDTTIRRCPVVILISACQVPGPDVARTFAEMGARVIAIDNDPAGLAKLCSVCPERIEPLTVRNNQIEVFDLLKEALADEPIDMVVNLMPLVDPGDISKHMRALSVVMRTMVQGLIAAKGCIATVVPRPKDRFAIAAQGLSGAIRAASVALSEELAEKSVRVQVVSVPPEDPQVALDLLIYLGSRRARHIKSTVFDLG